MHWGDGDGLLTFNIPDLRGVFIRGVNGTRADAFTDPDVNSRTDNGQTEKNNVGSFQSVATALPQVNFVGISSDNGNHSHKENSQVWANIAPTVAGSNYVARGTGGNFMTTHTTGGGLRADIYTHTSEHSHSINIDNGGDNETRPVNAYVNYIIKY